MSKGNFVQSARIGSQGENSLIELLINNGFQAEKESDKTKQIEYDVISNIGTFEVKYDLYSAKSGNLALEFYNTKKCAPSGIDATKADYWVFVLPCGAIYCVATAILREFMKENKPHRTIVSGGDNNSSMYLYKKDVILEIFTDLTKLTTEDAHEYFALPTSVT